MYIHQDIAHDHNYPARRTAPHRTAAALRMRRLGIRTQLPIRARLLLPATRTVGLVDALLGARLVGNARRDIVHDGGGHHAHLDDLHVLDLVGVPRAHVVVLERRLERRLRIVGQDAVLGRRKHGFGVDVFEQGGRLVEAAAPRLVLEVVHRFLDALGDGARPVVAAFVARLLGVGLLGLLELRLEVVG